MVREVDKPNLEPLFAANHYWTMRRGQEPARPSTGRTSWRSPSRARRELRPAERGRPRLPHVRYHRSCGRALRLAARGSAARNRVAFAILLAFSGSGGSRGRRRRRRAPLADARAAAAPVEVTPDSMAASGFAADGCPNVRNCRHTITSGHAAAAGPNKSAGIARYFTSPRRMTSTMAACPHQEPGAPTRAVG